MRRRSEEFTASVRELLENVGEGAPSVEDKLRILERMRATLQMSLEQTDRMLIEQHDRIALALAEVREAQAKLKAELERLTAPPWHPAVLIELTDEGRALVAQGTGRRVVSIAPGVDLNHARPGDEVYLSIDMNLLLGVSRNGPPGWGELAVFQRWTPDGRIVLQHRGDQEVVVTAGGALIEAQLKPGDLLRWQSNCWMAMERLPADEANGFEIEEVPDVSRDQVGGQAENLDLMISVLGGALCSPDRAALYAQSGRQSIIMIGAPGCGKTLMVRVAAAELQRMTGQRCYFSVVKPGEFEDPYVGVTQQRIRACFAKLREAARDGMAILFLDEIESIGRIRGGVASQHADKFLAALLAEIDGFNDRSSIAIITATNRKDLVDPALLERLSDIEIIVNRPGMQAARRIFEIHLPETLPYADEHTRHEMIERAIARLYFPNADNDLCTIQFRDGTRRMICARELVSGRCFGQICRSATRTGFLRDMKRQDGRLQPSDMDAAVADAIAKLSTTLTPRNVHAYLADLPQDVDVVNVQPIVRRVANPGRYLNVA